MLIYTFNKTATTEEDMSQFRKEIAQFTKIRHENIMLFMGACIEPNNLAVITRYVCFVCSNLQRLPNRFDTLENKPGFAT